MSECAGSHRSGRRDTAQEGPSGDHHSLSSSGLPAGDEGRSLGGRVPQQKTWRWHSTRENCPGGTKSETWARSTSQPSPSDRRTQGAGRRYHGHARRCLTDPSAASSTDVTAPSLRPWQRLAVRLAAAFALLTLLTVVLVGVVIRERHKRELEDTVGTQLLNIARTGALLVDPALHAEVTRTRTSRSDAYVRIREALGAMQQETLLTTPIYTLTDLDPAARRARIMVASDSSAKPGDALALPAELVEPLGWTFEDGVARYTRVYVTPKGKRITAFAPIVDRMGRATAVLTVDYPVDIYLDRLSELDTTIWRSSLIAAVAALILGLLFARRLTRPISALTGAVGRVAAGDLSQTVPVRSRDEVGQLGRAFNEMVTGLRQRDFIRNAFGRYVSPEVAQTLLESPDGLRLGGHKREITVLMSDLRGYTRFAEMGDPVSVMDVLNDYLGRMADLIIAHGGSINEFIGDAIFAVFGAPLDQPDHAERAAAAALAMQRAMDEFNHALARRAAVSASRWASASAPVRPWWATSGPSSGRSTRWSGPRSTWPAGSKAVRSAGRFS